MRKVPNRSCSWKLSGWGFDINGRTKLFNKNWLDKFTNWFLHRDFPLQSIWGRKLKYPIADNQTFNSIWCNCAPLKDQTRNYHLHAYRPQNINRNTWSQSYLITIPDWNSRLWLHFNLPYIVDTFWSDRLINIIASSFIDWFATELLRPNFMWICKAITELRIVLRLSFHRTKEWTNWSGLR